jgi:hypothetical protein
VSTAAQEKTTNTTKSKENEGKGEEVEVQDGDRGERRMIMISLMCSRTASFLAGAMNL